MSGNFENEDAVVSRTMALTNGGTLDDLAALLP